VIEAEQKTTVWINGSGGLARQHRYYGTKYGKTRQFSRGGSLVLCTLC